MAPFERKPLVLGERVRWHRCPKLKCGVVMRCHQGPKSLVDRKVGHHCDPKFGGCDYRGFDFEIGIDVRVVSTTLNLGKAR